MKTDLAGRLGEALDRAEQQTRSAMHLGDGKWRVDHGYGKPCPDECGCCRVEGAEITIYDEGGHDEHQAAHIAAWDPKRVLALIARDRALLAAHASADRNVSDHVASCGPDLCGGRDYLAASTTLQVLTTAVEVASKFWLAEEATDD